MIRVSVIIPTRNRPGPLAACLRALTVGFPLDAETIVVSDGGTEDLTVVIAPFIEPLRLQLLQVEHGGPAAARNRGLKACRGEIVAFTDDDCLPRPGWLAALGAGVVVSPPHAVGGSTFCIRDANAYADAAQLILFLLSRYDRAAAGRERLLPSNNFAFPLAPLVRLGGFDENFRTAEDRELCRRWAEQGFTLGRVPHAVVEHDEHLNWKRFIRKFSGYGRGAAQFHGSAKGSSLFESLRFHFRLPILLLPELRKRSVTRAAAIVGLLIVWEFANLAGYVAQRWVRPAPNAVSEKLRAETRVG